MKIKPYEIGAFLKEMLSVIALEKSKLQEIINEKDKEIMGLNAVVITLKDARNEYLNKQPKE